TVSERSAAVVPDRIHLPWTEPTGRGAQGVREIGRDRSRLPAGDRAAGGSRYRRKAICRRARASAEAYRQGSEGSASLGVAQQNLSCATGFRPRRAGFAEGDRARSEARTGLPVVG